MKSICTLLLAALTASAASAATTYVVAVSRPTQADPAWSNVVEALRSKHGAGVVTYATNVTETLPRLRELFPRHVAFVARPAEANRAFVTQVHQLARQLDDDPYADCFWGIVTGYDASNALVVARETAPLTVRKAASGTELAMDMLEEGVWFCELKQGRMVCKEKGGEARELKGPDDTTEALVKSLNEGAPDLFVTSGHATERDWMIGFRYRNGFFKHANGQLYGLDTQGHRYPIHSPNPKVYLPVGNCLMGHIDQPDCMALSWMNSAGVRQMAGYIEPTWYGYMGWGLLDYFVEQPGRFTLTEAFFANQAALIHRLHTYFPDSAAAPQARSRSATSPAISEAARAAGLGPMDARGLLFDRDVVAFYGDPAWNARLADGPRAWEQTLTRSNETWTFVVTPRRGAKSFEPVNRNGSQRGGRPIVQFLPARVKDVALLEGSEWKPVVTDDFVLVPLPTQVPERPMRVVFRASPLAP